MNLPLSGIRVLDMGRILAAPFAGQMFGDLGAEVIKIERPEKGDDSRIYGPPFLKNSEGCDTRESSFYISVNRNKKSVSIDISTAEGQDIVRELAKSCDVVLENYKVGDLKRYRLDYESLREINPRLIYCSLTGFGQTGPYSARPGYDSVFQGMSGLMSVTGHPDGAPGGGPMKTGPSLADIIAGQFAVGAIIAALYHRDIGGGVGQHLDVSLLDSLIAANSHYASHYLVSDDLPVRRGTEGNGGMPSRLFRCADGDIMLVAGNDEQFRRLCAALKRDELANDARFSRNIDRVKNRRELGDILEPIFEKSTCADLLKALEVVGVPAGPINNLKQVFEDVHVRSREMRVEIDHPLSATGKVAIVAHPVKYSNTPVTHYTAPPSIGQHTNAVLTEILGLSHEDIEILRARQVVS